MVNPFMPRPIAARATELHVEGSSALLAQRWLHAAQTFDALYRFLIESQQRSGMRFYKGAALQNAGIGYLNVAENEQAILRFVLSYVEDVLSAERQADADDAPAGRTIRALEADSNLRTQIKTIAQRAKLRGSMPLDPSEVLREVPGVDSVPPNAIGVDLRVDIARRARRTIEGLEGSFDRRCFVGGNYFVGGPNLADMRLAVETAGYDPIIPYDFAVDNNDIHHRSLMLLHLCSKAVFEVTSPAGQLMELERCRDYDISPLIVRQVIAPGEDPVVSAMIGSMAEAMVHSYARSSELARLIIAYLAP